MEVQTSNLIDVIKKRKSIRNFIFKKLTQQVIKEILECGRFALEENETQPYRVNVVVHPTVKMMLGEISPEYADIYEAASCCFVIFLDLERSTDRIKDLLAIGALIENILLGVHAIPKIGAISLDINMDHKDKINEIFKLSSKRYEFMGLICVGAINEELERVRSKKTKNRRPIEEFTDWF
jgi:nitroreductase